MQSFVIPGGGGRVPSSGRVGFVGSQLSPVQHSILHCITFQSSRSLRAPLIAAQALSLSENKQTPNNKLKIIKNL